MESDRDRYPETHYNHYPPVGQIHFFLAGAAFLAPAAPPPIFLASCLNLKLLFFLLIMTLNLSKSFRLALLALRAIFLAMEVAAHFSPSLILSAAALGRKVNRRTVILLDGAGSGAREDGKLDGGESESLNGVEGAGEVGGGSVNEDSVLINNCNNHANLAEILSEVHVDDSAWLNEVLEDLKIRRTLSDLAI